MSLVDLFFNASYRESMLDAGFCSNKKSKPIKEKTKEQREKERGKLLRDYHLDSMRREVRRLETEMIYGFIKKENVTLENFITYLNKRNARQWVIPILWKELSDWMVNNKIK